jgi:hypothetical protein
VKAVTIHTLPCTICHRLPSREDTTRPIFHNLGDSALPVRHRPGLDPTSTPSTVQQEKKDGMAWRSESFRRLILYVTVVSRDGQPFLGHVATVTSTGIDKTSPQGSRRPGLLSPYKRAGQGSTMETEDNEEQTTHKSQAKCQALQGSSTEINISSNHLCTLFSLFETWARRPLSQACNPYTSTSVQGNTKVSPPLDIGSSFARTRINPHVFSLHHHPG